MKTQLSIFCYCALLTFFAISSSCQSGNSGTSESIYEPTAAINRYTGARLVQVDSIMIDVIGNFRVYDYQPETNLFLGGDIGPIFQIILGGAPKVNQLGHVVFNRQGEILHQFNNANNGPKGHGGGAYGNFFLGPEKVGVMGSKALHVYGLEGGFERKFSNLNLKGQVGIANQRSLFSKEGRFVVFGLGKRLTSESANKDSLFQIARPLWFYDLEQSTTEGGLEHAALLASHGFPSHPIYAPGSEFHHDPYPPLMVLDSEANRLLAVHPEISSMSFYDMETGALIDTVDLNPDHFTVETKLKNVPGGLPGYEWLAWFNKGGRMANSKYLDMIQLGEYTLLRYNVALPAAVVEKLVSGLGVNQDPEWPSLRKKHYRFYYQLFKNGEKVLPDFELPLLEPDGRNKKLAAGIFTRGRLVGGTSLDEVFVFIPNDGEEERDYELIRVYKLELIEETK